MKKQILCLLFASGGLITSCVDSDYDLSNLKTDNIAIGDESMVKKMPLVKVNVSMNEIANDNSDILVLCNKADAWLPSPLPGSVDYLDLTRVNEASYIGALFDALTDQMVSDSEKLDIITDLVYEDHASDFSAIFGIPETQMSQFKELFKASFNNSAVRSVLRRCFIEFLTTDLNVAPLHYDLGNINLGEDVIDMLADNLDPEGTANPRNTLHLAGQIISKLPITMQIEPKFSSEWNDIVSFSAVIDATREINEIVESDQTRIYAEDLRQLVGGAEISIPITFERYYPGNQEFLNTPENDDSPQVEITLHLIKRGGIKFDI